MKSARGAIGGISGTGNVVPAIRCVLAVAIGATAVAASVGAAEPAAERVRITEVFSEALGRSLPLAVVRPAEIPADRSAPVLFFLHGRGRDHRSLIDSPAARKALLNAPFFIILPKGEDGWYIDSPVRQVDRYGAYLGEIVAWADRMLPVSRETSRRGVTGWSMGGYGAVRFAEAHPDQFGFVASIIGLLDFPRESSLPEGQNYAVPRDRFGTSAASWQQFNPLEHVAALRGKAVTLVLATRGFEWTMNRNFIAALTERGIEPRIHKLEGGHEFPLVERAVPLVLADAAEFFQNERRKP